jgi:hypothetical protein
MQTFNAMPIRDKWRVRGFLARGEAPSEPHTATAAVELAESYSRQGRLSMAWMRWFPAFFLVVIGLSAIPRAIEGELAMAILYAVVVLVSIGHLIFAPVTRPKKMARSLEASRRVAGSGD